MECPTCFLANTQICEGHFMYIPTFAFHEEEFNTFCLLDDDTFMVIEQDWLLCYNYEEDHLVFKVVGVSHMATMRSTPFSV